MKTYRVVIEPPALAQIEQYHVRAVEAGARLAADRWFNRLQAAILSLATMPTRAGKVPDEAQFTQPLWQLVFEKRYRVVFTIQEDAVHVLCVRGLGLPPLQADDIDGSVLDRNDP